MEPKSYAFNRPKEDHRQGEILNCFVVRATVIGKTAKTMVFFLRFTKKDAPLTI